jgi:hypothetical protein
MHRISLKYRTSNSATSFKDLNRTSRVFDPPILLYRLEAKNSEAKPSEARNNPSSCRPDTINCSNKPGQPTLRRLRN